MSPLSPSDVGPEQDGPAQVAGRLVRDAAGGLALSDALGRLPIELGAGDAPSTGELVVCTGTLEGGVLRGASVLRAAPGHAGDETARLATVGPHLAARSALLRTLRGAMHDAGYLEVHTATVVPSPGLDLHLDALGVDGGRYLITSPEYQMKRLLAGGLPRIYQLTPCHRRGEVGGLHNPEFLMLEWYRAHASVDAMIDETEALVRRLLAGGVTRDGVTVDVTKPFLRMTVDEAFVAHAGLAPGASLALADDDEEQFFRLLVDAVEPALAKLTQPVFLRDYPASQASLARLSPSDPRVCERFELYVAGVELCNGFGELTDPAEQRARLERDAAARDAAGKPPYPIDERFLAALEEGMPAAAGNALGVDRLIMLALGAATIGEVQAFPHAWL